MAPNKEAKLETISMWMISATLHYTRFVELTSLLQNEKSADGLSRITSSSVNTLVFSSVGAGAMGTGAFEDKKHAHGKRSSCPAQQSLGLKCIPTSNHLQYKGDTRSTHTSDLEKCLGLMH